MIRQTSDMQNNILLVFTGGTIGSQTTAGTIDTCSHAAYQLIALFQQHFPQHAEINFTTLQPLQILSENLHPHAWQTVIAAIEQQNLSQFDGIIVTHGTDTLAFTAACFAEYFQHLPVPLLLVSSDMPLSNPKANGIHNFLCAIAFIRQQRLNGVFVAYQNPGQSMQIHLGARLSSCLPLSSDFISVQSQSFMQFSEGHFTTTSQSTPAKIKPTKLSAKFGRLLLIRPYPGLNYADYQLDNVDAVLHDLYHSGTACVSQQWGEQHSLIAFSKSCQQQGKTLYLAPALFSEAAYSSTRELLANGVQILWNQSLETAYAKLLLAYGNFADQQQRQNYLFAANEDI